MIQIEKIGERIRYLRKKAGLSMLDLGKLCKSSTGYISDIENGNSLPGTEKLIDICNALNISIAELLGDEIVSEPMTDEIKELVDLLNQIKPEQRKLVRSLLIALLSK